MNDEEIRKLTNQIEENSERYERIPKAKSNEGYEVITTVKDEHLTELLEVAINGKGAFRRLMDVLLNYPQEREQRFQFKDDRMGERALEWLESINVSLTEE